MNELKQKIAKFNSIQAIAAIVLIFLMGCIISPGSFLTSGNMMNIIKQSITIALAAYGMTFVVIAGSIDLSVPMGAVVGAYTCLLLCKVNVLLAILAACTVCCLIGVVNAFLINNCKFPSMIATYAMAMLLKGVLILIIGNASYNVKDMPAALNYLGFGTIMFGIPFSAVVLVGFCLIAAFLVKKIPSIRNIYAVGGNEEAAKMMGINVSRTRYLAHILCGIFTGLAGVNMAARVNSAVVTGGTGLDMMAIASIVIGGVMMTGGRGKMYAGLLGALVMAMLSNVFKLQTMLNYYYEEAVIGTMLIVVLLVQAVLAARSRGRS